MRHQQGKLGRATGHNATCLGRAANQVHDAEASRGQICAPSTRMHIPANTVLSVETTLPQASAPEL